MADLLDLQKDRYLTVEMVGGILSCTERHIRDLVMEGSLIAIKVGSRAIRISERSLDEFVENNKVNPEDLYDPDRDEKKTTIPPRQVARSTWMSK